VASARPLQVAFDLTQIDNQTLGSGQYRYAVDLVNGLAATGSSVRVVLLGSLPQPRDEFVPALREGDRCRYVALPPYHGPGYYYFDVLRLSAWLAVNRVDVFHQLHTNLPLVKACPVVVTGYHYYYDAALFATRPHRYYRWALGHRADLVLTISDATRDDFHAHYGIPFERMRTVHPGLSSSLSVGTIARRPRPYLLSPYNLSGPKNLRALIVAWPSIAETDPQLELVLYGYAQVRPDNEAEFERLLAETRYADRIHRTGHITDAELADLFAGCTLFVFPTTVEGFGYPLLEAMAHGACCVARDASAMREIGGDAVCLVETLRPEAIARAAIDLLADPDRRTALGARAAERARRFTVEEMIRKTVECYREVTAPRSGDLTAGQAPH